MNGASKAEPAIRLEGVTKAFDGRKVLDDITLEVRTGSGFCLLGRSGTGKSVTLKHIVGLLKPDKGHVYVHGKDVPSLPARVAQMLRAQSAALSIAGQNFALWTDYEGYDPEVISNAGAQFNRDDFFTQPPVSRWIFRVNLTF